MAGIQKLNMSGFAPHVLAASLVKNVLSLALPLVVLHLFDRVIPSAGHTTLTVFAIVLLVAAIGDFAVQLARGLLVSVTACRFEVESFQSALARVFHSGTDPEVLSDTGLADRFANIGRVRRRCGNELSMALLDVPFIALFLVLMVLISPQIGLASATIASISLVVVALFRRKINRLESARKDYDRRRRMFLTETLEEIGPIQTLGISALMRRRYERLMSSAVTLTHDLGASAHFTKGLTGTISLGAPILIAGLGATLVIRGEMTLGGLVAAVLLNSQVIQPILRLEALIANERELRPAMTEVNALMNAPHLRTGTEKLSAIETIELKGIGPGVAGSDDLNLRLTRGMCVSIDTTGNAAQALLSILSGHTPPKQGRYLINGALARRFDPEDLTQRISHLTGDMVMFEGTLLDNMTRFEPEQYRDSALALSRRLDLDHFINRHSEGYGMHMAHGRSGALPRAIMDRALMIGGLVHKPDLILFDETNQVFDQQMDGALIQLLKDLRPDVILVLLTNRPSLRALADQHISLDQNWGVS